MFRSHIATTVNFHVLFNFLLYLHFRNSIIFVNSSLVSNWESIFNLKTSAIISFLCWRFFKYFLMLASHDHIKWLWVTIFCYKWDIHIDIWELSFRFFSSEISNTKRELEHFFYERQTFYIKVNLKGFS